MRSQLKPLSQQVIVITGASSGIGLATAEAAARKGACVVLVARSKNTLTEIADRLGKEVLAVEADVADRGQVDNVANRTILRFGRIDTWVNNAAFGIYGTLEQTNEDDAHRLFEVNFWGVVHGSMVALPYLRRQGGALINVGSEVSEGVSPLLGMYSATKHAVKGFTDALRVEIEHVEKAPISVTLIQPTAVDTPFPQHARNYMPTEPDLPKSRIDPEQVAEAILNAAETPTRAKRVGANSVINTTVFKLAPKIADRMAAGKIDELRRDESPHHPEGALHCASEDLSLAGSTHPVV